jgi:hypothetical protein
MTRARVLLLFVCATFVNVAVLAIVSSMVGTTLAKQVLDAMSDQQYRRWANGIITAIAGYYVVHGTVLAVLAHAYAG